MKKNNLATEDLVKYPEINKDIQELYKKAKED